MRAKYRTSNHKLVNLFKVDKELIRLACVNLALHYLATLEERKQQKVATTTTLQSDLEYHISHLYKFFPNRMPITKAQRHTLVQYAEIIFPYVRCKYLYLRIIKERQKLYLWHHLPYFSGVLLLQ